ncbi:MAG: hypothetical protein OEZ34_08570 [Spirochaetia bacterium]|nr:hypothetical protein [Spirochaetia bacterium]
MKYKISTQPDHQVEISISEASEPSEVLASLQECSEGRCSCRTDEYKKLKNLEVQEDSDSGKISIKLTPSEGNTFNITEIQKCLNSIEYL